MPGPADPRLLPAESVGRHLRVGRRLAEAVTRSHLADGRVVGWYGPPGVVIDAEIGDQPVPRAVAARFGAGATPREFWARWTRSECAAKLADVPITLWLAVHGLDPAGHDVVTVPYEDLVVSVGFPGGAGGPGRVGAAQDVGGLRTSRCACWNRSPSFGSRTNLATSTKPA